LALAATTASAQTVNAICSTDQPWCEAAAREFSKATGIKVLQTRKATGEAMAQLAAEAGNPKTDLWWGGTGDPYLQAAGQGLLEAYRPERSAGLERAPVGDERQHGRRLLFQRHRLRLQHRSAQEEESARASHLPAPACWADLIKPQYKGEIEVSHPASSGTAYTILAGLVQMMGEEPALDYLKKLHRNTIAYTRSGNAQAPNVAKGEVAIGVSFMFTFEGWRHKKYPVVTAAPCEGTGYEIGGIALIKGARNAEAARRYYDWLMSPQGQALGATVDSLQVPANKTFKSDARIPSMDTVKLIKYDFEKYGRAAERKRLIDRWSKEVESLPR